MKDYEQKKAAKKFAEYWKYRGYEKAAEPIVWFRFRRFFSHIKNFV